MMKPDLPYYVYIVLSLVVAASFVLLMCVCCVFICCIVFNQRYLDTETIYEEIVDIDEDMR